MSFSMCLVAGSNGRTLEVEQLDLFEHRIGEKVFSFAIHKASDRFSSADTSPLMISLYETGCKIANLSVSGTGAMAQHQSHEADREGLRNLALSSIQDIINEIGCDRLSLLLQNSLNDHLLLNS